MANHKSARRSRRVRSVPRCVGCGELVASPAIVRCGFCAARQPTSRHEV
jgi:hypothetical protein